MIYFKTIVYLFNSVASTPFKKGISDRISAINLSAGELESSIFKCESVINSLTENLAVRNTESRCFRTKVMESQGKISGQF